jgi:ketopantoate reductase
VIELAKERAIPVPHLERLHATVKAVESGSRPQSFEALLSIGA